MAGKISGSIKIKTSKSSSTNSQRNPKPILIMPFLDSYSDTTSIQSSNSSKNNTNKMENLYTPNCIRTHSLSMQCRFAGHLPRFYSVAQHSVVCSYLVDENQSLQALLHDASEAYLLDIPSPIKKQLPQYQQAEHKLMIMIAEKFGFKYPLHPQTQKSDRIMLEFEWEHIMLKFQHCFYKFPNGRFGECWSPDQAKEEFLNRFKTIISSHYKTQ